MPTPPPAGIMLVDKPVGCSSFAVVRAVRRMTGERKVGHAGTLDPLASGLLVLGVGQGTKLLAHCLKLPKVYEAEICLGERSTTADREGAVLEAVGVAHVDPQALRGALAGMVGTLALPVPAFSAVKRGGVPLYKKARRGEVVAVPVRPMTVTEAMLLGEPAVRQSRAYVAVRFAVSSGTYIRSLAEELGRRVGLPARLENLRRTQVGEWRVEDATTVEL